LRALRAAPRVRRPTRTFQAFRSNVASPTGLARALLTLAAVRIGNMIAVILFSEVVAMWSFMSSAGMVPVDRRTKGAQKGEVQ